MAAGAGIVRNFSQQIVEASAQVPPPNALGSPAPSPRPLGGGRCAMIWW